MRSSLPVTGRNATLKSTRLTRRKTRTRRDAGARAHFHVLRMELLEQRALLSIGAATPDYLGTSGGDLLAEQNVGDAEPAAMQFHHMVVGSAAPAAARNALSERPRLPATVTAPDMTPLSSPSPVGFAPEQIRTAYGLDLPGIGSVVGYGAGQTIAIIGAYDAPNLVSTTDPNYLNSDLHQFSLAFGLPDPPSFTKLDQYGGTNYPAPSGWTGWSLEASLDVEWAHAIAPQANIVLIEADSPYDSDLIAIAVNTARNLPGVSVVSMSFGRGEYPQDLALNSFFTTPSGHPGVTFLASSGDWGSPGCFPAYSPNVVAVGGTTLTLSGNNYAGETGWGGSGGGQSSYQTQPSYQAGVQNSGWRQIPDVAFDADPASGVAVYDSYDFSSAEPWVQIGGTSVSAPNWAGLMAIANQLRLAQGFAPLDGFSETLPNLYAMPAANFHDITSGTNGDFSAAAGYDLVTGLGSPLADKVIPALAPALPAGVVHFSAHSYEIGTAATINVADSNAASVQVTVVSSAGDSEVLTLAARGPSAFQGSITISNGTAAPGNGVLEVIAGGTITVAYSDVDDGSGHLLTVTDQATTFAHLQITTPSLLPTAPKNLPYSVALSATGGAGAYTWSAPTTGNYTESDPGSGWLGGGMAMGWRADDSSWRLDLPWAFPFYGTNYQSVWVTSNGFLDFTSSWSSPGNSPSALKFATRIAPLWYDLVTSGVGDDIFITMNANYVVVRWGAHTWWDNLPASAEVVLYRDGNIKFNYGEAQTGFWPTVGVSKGDGLQYTFSTRDGAGSIPEYVSSLFAYPSSLPAGLSLSPSGVLSGTPTGPGGGYDFAVAVVDAHSPPHADTRSFHLDVIALPRLTLAVPSDANEDDGTVTAVLSIPTALGSDLTVNLTSSDASRATVPASVSIRAGDTSLAVAMTIVDNSALDGREAVSIVATAAGYLPGTGVITVHDNERALLAVSLPASAQEGDGAILGAGTVTASEAPTRDITVQLVSSDPTAATVAATVTLPAGQTSADFDVTIIDDTRIDGLQTAMITARVENWRSGSAAISVLDNDATVAVTLPGDAWEGQGVLPGAGTVRIGGTLEAALVISLACGDLTELAVPLTVTVPAGQFSANFDLSIQDDSEHDGPQAAQVTATAAGLGSGTASMLVRDNDLDHYGFDPIGSPRTAAVPFAATARAYDVLGNPILVYSGPATLSALGEGGPLPISPTSVTFASGAWTGSITINAVEPSARLRLDEVAGAHGLSNMFALEPGAVDHFQWSTVPSPQYRNGPFAATLTAKDAHGFTAAGFDGSAALSGWTGSLPVPPAPPPGGPLAFGDVKLLGSDLKLGVNADGSLIVQDSSLGVNFLGDEFLVPGTPQASFTLAVNGSNYHNNAPAAGSAIAMTVTDISADGMLHAQAVGERAGIHIVRDIWFAPTSHVVTFQVVLQNTTPTALSNVAWLENYDPDQGIVLGGNFHTHNDVLFGGHYAEAAYYASPLYPQGLTMGIGSPDSRAVASTEGFDVVDPFEVLQSPVDGDGGWDDIASNLAFNVGSLGPGASTTLSYFVVFATDRQAAADLYQAQLPTAVPVAPTTVTFAGGMWSGNVTVLQTANNMFLRADGAGHVGSSNTFDVLAAPPTPAASVLSRLVFYNNSVWDGQDPAANALDDTAVAADKQALESGAAGFANYTNYSLGLNGMIVDIAGLLSTSLSATNSAATSDFEFRVGNDSDPGHWQSSFDTLDASPLPTSVSIRPGTGVGGSDRVTLIWADHAIENQWLQVRVVANSRTGLAADDVFSFGNAIASLGNHAGTAAVEPADVVEVGAHKTGFALATITDLYDFNRDRRVNATDVLIAQHGASEASPLQLITLTDPADWLDAWALLSEINSRLKKDQPAENPLNPPPAMTWR